MFGSLNIIIITTIVWALFIMPPLGDYEDVEVQDIPAPILSTSLRPESDYTCRQNSDCVLIPQREGCCSICGMEAVNTEAPEEVNDCAIRDMLCKAVECTTSNVGYFAVCEQNRCVAKTKPIIKHTSPLSLSFGLLNDLPLTTIEHINQESKHLREIFGKYNVEGYVSHISDCPVCPKDAVCEACLRPHIIISKIFGGSYEGSDTEQLFIALNKENIQENPSRFFEIGKKYRFSIQIDEDYKFAGAYGNSDISHIKLLGYKERKEKTSSNFNAKIIGSYTSPGESSQIALWSLWNGIIYLTDISEGLLAIDVTDPTNPKLIDSMKIGGGGAYAVALSDAEENETRVLVSGYGNNKIALINVENTLPKVGRKAGPRKMRLLAEGIAKRSVQNITSTFGKWYLSIDGPEFEVFNNNFASNETGMGELISSGTIQTTPGGHVLDIAMSQNGQKIVVAQGAKGIGVLNRYSSVKTNGLVKSLDTPKMFGEIVLPNNGYAQATVRYVYDNLDDARAYYVWVIAGSKLWAIDVTHGILPRDSIILKNSGAAVDVAGNIAVVAIWDKGVQVIDITDPYNLISLGIVDTPGRARDVVVQQKDENTYLIYVADDRDDLQIIEFKR